ncbi:hypothetical protein [Streptomyces yaizuensis]|uniref:Uncharacterized protein n=1 Tax=Streptomyces yaizuensis TaxID=2989713 RepID=A0ABQ5P4Y6_9ACTN|nr:hypothetical protein [Streptomyces sp. YSPA8]GLF97614.1 hypothetical protein SYYSPA8_24975 [Streptomyces sp. YSPA8]
MPASERDVQHFRPSRRQAEGERPVRAVPPLPAVPSPVPSPVPSAFSMRDLLASCAAASALSTPPRETAAREPGAPEAA